MATFNKFQQFVEDLAHKVHDLETDDLRVILSNTIPVNTEAVLSEITQIANGNGYTTDGKALTTVVSGQTAGTYKLSADDLVWTAGPSAMAQFQYIVLYNESSVTPLGPLIGWWDYGSAVDLANGETFTWDVTASGILTLGP